MFADSSSGSLIPPPWAATGGLRPPSRVSAGPPGVRLAGLPRPALAKLLTEECVEFVVDLSREFDPRRRELLARRGWFRDRLRSGERPGFLPETAEVRSASWQVAAPPPDLIDRRVEITGPPDRKMVINALNSGASVYMADFEDAHAPTWSGTLEGQRNLYDAVRRQISFQAPGGRRYRLRRHTATLMMRPRGWHLEERHLVVDGAPVSASLFDFGVFAYLNARELVDRGSGPYVYLPKLEDHREAILWNDVFGFSERRLRLPPASVRATVLIETLPAAFQMDEILWALHERSVGLNCGRWDYIFSFLKQLRDDPSAVLPDRSRLSMEAPFLDRYARLLIATCHRRGAHALGGMAAEIPIRGDPDTSAAAIARVTADKEREVRLGHDGTWVAHPALVAVARQVFDRGMPTPNQIDAPPPGRPVDPAGLFEIPPGEISDAGVRANVRVALRYLESWLSGVGCVPIDHRMEDAATVEIARSQLWQWVRHGATTTEGTAITETVVRELLRSEHASRVAELRRADGSAANCDRARAILQEVVTAPDLVEFLTARAYPELMDAP
ncbi:MAG: malate synthase A [Thermoplasmata archaeon]|nr:malate synthase A [Thermoplasmata archaeon]